MNNMHILIIPSWYVNSYNPLSGIFFKEQAEALAEKENIFIGLIAIQAISIKNIFSKKRIDFGIKKFVRNNVHTTVVQYPSIPKMTILRRKIAFEIFKLIFKRYIKENGLPDIVHLHSFLAGEASMWVKKNYNIPYVVTEHSSAFVRNILSDVELNLANRVFENSSKNIAVSKEFASLLENKFQMPFKYIPNVVNIDFFKIRNNNKDNKFKFINIAFLNKNKNQDMLIKAFTIAFSKNKKVELTIVGDGEEYNNLKNLIKKLKMEKQIYLYGRASRVEIRDLLQSSDAFVLSSKYETFGVVIIEAMACGLPVVSTKCGGPESIIINDNLGILCDKNEDTLSEAMLHLYNNKDKYSPKIIIEYVRNNFSKEAIVNKLISIYNRIYFK